MIVGSDRISMIRDWIIFDCFLFLFFVLFFLFLFNIVRMVDWERLISVLCIKNVLLQVFNKIAAEDC